MLCYVATYILGSFVWVGEGMYIYSNVTPNPIDPHPLDMIGEIGVPSINMMMWWWAVVAGGVVSG